MYSLSHQLLLPKNTDEKKRRKRKKNEEKLHDKENTTKVNKKFKQKKNKKLLDDDPDRPKRKYVRKQKKAEIVDIEGDDDDDDDDDEACSARPCKHPSSDEVDWVQCDTCEQWYHNLCVGITAETAAELESYICPYCSTTAMSTAASPDSNVDVVSTTPHATTPRSPRSPTAKQHSGCNPQPEVLNKSPTLSEHNPVLAVG